MLARVEGGVLCSSIPGALQWCEAVQTTRYLCLRDVRIFQTGLGSTSPYDVEKRTLEQVVSRRIKKNNAHEYRGFSHSRGHAASRITAVRIILSPQGQLSDIRRCD